AHGLQQAGVTGCADRIFEVLVRGCPGLAANVNRRDETTEWTCIIRPLLATGREPSERRIEADIGIIQKQGETQF
ncbi:MAG: hypothetical protein WCI17_06130, partial [bacterium]